MMIPCPQPSSALPMHQADAYRQACSHGLQYVYMFLSSLLEEQPPEHASMLLQNMPVSLWPAPGCMTGPAQRVLGAITTRMRCHQHIARTRTLVCHLMISYERKVYALPYALQVRPSRLSC
jgi:hypothetical protein